MHNPKLLQIERGQAPLRSYKFKNMILTLLSLGLVLTVLIMFIHKVV